MSAESAIIARGEALFQKLYGEFDSPAWRNRVAGDVLQEIRTAYCRGYARGRAEAMRIGLEELMAKYDQAVPEESGESRAEGRESRVQGREPGEEG
jgi:hypothetical protein